MSQVVHRPEKGPDDVEMPASSVSPDFVYRRAAYGEAAQWLTALYSIFDNIPRKSKNRDRYFTQLETVRDQCALFDKEGKPKDRDMDALLQATLQR